MDLRNRKFEIYNCHRCLKSVTVVDDLSEVLGQHLDSFILEGSIMGPIPKKWPK